MIKMYLSEVVNSTVAVYYLYLDSMILCAYAIRILLNCSLITPVSCISTFTSNFVNLNMDSKVTPFYVSNQSNFQPCTLSSINICLL